MQNVAISQCFPPHVEVVNPVVDLQVIPAFSALHVSGLFFLRSRGTSLFFR
jgi:hypothetical protein